MKPYEYSDEIADYLYNDMSEQEKSVFEEKMKSDSALAEEVARQKEMLDTRRLGKFLQDLENDPAYEETEALAEEAIKEYYAKKRREYLLSRSFRRKVIYPMAASFIGMIFLANIALYIISPNLAFQYYYQDYTPVYYAQATLDETQLLFAQSTNEYNKGNYAAVAENMRTMMEDGELNWRGAFMLGIHDALKEMYETIWDKKIDSTKTKQEEALWYLAITSYKLQDYDTAQSLFMEISKTDSKKRRKAARLNRKISRMH